MLKHPFPPAIRQSGDCFCILLACLCLGVAFRLPFSHESSSLLYKFGWDRIYLLSSKLCGILSAFLLMTQLLLASRISILDCFFGLDRLLKTHRHCGGLLLAASGLHPLLIVLSDGGWTIPFRLDYWPELLGILLLVSLWATVWIALFFKSLGLRFEQWWLGHRIVTPLLILFMGLHVLNVSETFAAGFPRYFLLSGLSASAVIWVWIRLRPLRRRQSLFVVEQVDSSAEKTNTLSLKSCRDQGFSYAPGQFAFVSVRSQQVSAEEHPFTIASAPGDTPDLQLVIRAVGDWTEHIPKLCPGETVTIDGPYGLFSYLSYPGAKDFVFIAGGVGITPFLSMLRQMRATRYQARVTLIWINQSRDRRIMASEMDQLAEDLPFLRIHDVFTRSPQGKKPDQQDLRTWLSACSGQAHCFVCGPPQMMQDMRNTLITLGFSRRRIHQERFAL